MSKKVFLGLCIILLFPITAFSQWSNIPAINNPVCTDSNLQQRPQIISDGSGGAIICWIDQRSAPGALFGDIYVQRIKKDGTPLWTYNGVALTSLQQAEHPKIISDGSGGGIICWIDYRKATTNNEESDVYAQRIDSSGNPVWADSGIVIAADSNFLCARIALLSDASGGAFITWDVNHGTMNSNRILAQHINNNGQLLWDSSNQGVQVCTSSSSYDAFQPRIASDGDGGVVICWLDNRSGDKDNIYAQRIDASGQRKWTTYDQSVCSNSNSDAGNADIISEPGGRVIIVWDDTRTGTSSYSWNIYAQELDSLGTLLWQSDGLPLTHDAYHGKYLWPFITSDNHGGAFVSYYQNTSVEGLLMQHIDSSGTTIWADSVVLDSHVVYPGSGLFEEANNLDFLANDGNGHAMVTWVGATGLKIQKVTDTGSVIWGMPGDTMMLPSTTAVQPENPTLIVQDSGRVIITWQDSRQDQGNIYAARLPRDTSPSKIYPIELSNNISLYPNPGNNQLYIRLNQPQKGSVFIYDMQGREVKKYSIHQTNATFSVSNLPEGLYRIKIQTARHTWTQLWVKAPK